jgi:hypothetical protein
LNALCICIEAYPASEYRALTLEGLEKRTNALKGFGQALNYSDFVREVSCHADLALEYTCVNSRSSWPFHTIRRLLQLQTWKGIQFLMDYTRKHPRTRSTKPEGSDEGDQDSGANLDIDAAFNAGSKSAVDAVPQPQTTALEYDQMDLESKGSQQLSDRSYRTSYDNMAGRGFARRR